MSLEGREGGEGGKDEGGRLGEGWREGKEGKMKEGGWERGEGGRWKGRGAR